LTARAPRPDRWPKVAVGLGLAVLLVHTAVAVAIDLDAYADGAWFDFAARVGEPLHLVWRNYPTRITAYLVRYAPAFWLIRVQAPPALALAAGHALWQLAPAASLAACWRAAPAGAKAAVLFPAGYFLLLGPLTWGFPTETWLGAAFAWPAAMVLLYGRDTVASALLGGLLLLGAVFSHETALLLLPLFVLAGALRWRQGARRVALGAVAGAALAGALWLGARLAFRPDPIIADSLRGNAASFFGMAALIDHPALKKDLLIALAAGLALAVGAMGPALRRPALVLGLLLGLAVLALDFGVAGATRYQVRSVAALGLAGGIALLLADRAWDGALRLWWARPAVLPVLLGAVALMAAATGWENARFAVAWVRYDRAASAAVNCPAGGGPCHAPVIDLDPAITHGPAGWAWAAPFYSVLVSRDLETSSIARDDVLAGQPIQGGTWARVRRGLCVAAGRCAGPAPAPVVQRGAPSFIPLSCADARALTIDGRRPRAIRALAGLACGAAR